MKDVETYSSLFWLESEGLGLNETVVGPERLTSVSTTRVFYSSVSFKYWCVPSSLFENVVSLSSATVKVPISERPK